MPRTPATKEQKEAIRSKIRQAAAELYRETGLSNITARAIAVRAEVSVGTIYAHFGSLSELMQSLWQEPVERFETRLRKTAASVESPLERVTILCKEYLGFARRNPELYRSSFLFVRPRDMEVSNKMKLEERAFSELMMNTIEEGQASGVFRQEDPRVATQLIWAAIHGVIALPINLDRIQWDNEKRLEEEMIELVLRSIQN